MEFWFRIFTYFVLLVYPVLMGLLFRYKKITIKQVIITTNTLLSIFFGLIALVLPILDKPQPSLLIVQKEDWIFSMGLSIGLWLFFFAITKPFYKD
jgi:hypothetical protein